MDELHVGWAPKNRGIFPPKWMVKIMENRMNKWMIWEVNTPIFGNIHVGFSRNSDYQPGPVPASTRFDTVVLFYLNMSKFYL